MAAAETVPQYQADIIESTEVVAASQERGLMRDLAGRAVGALVLTGAVLASTLTSHNDAPAELQQPGVELADYNLVPNYQHHWWGDTWTFNREATAIIATGAGEGVSALPGVAWLSMVGLGAAGEMAHQAVDHGNCLEIVELNKSPLVAWPWRAHC